MTPLMIYLNLLLLHFIADFVFQSHWMASNKSKDISALSLHVLTYTFTFFVALSFVALSVKDTQLTMQTVALYCFVNGLLHFMIDACTSKITALLYKKQDWHNFFVVVGADQFLHHLSLGLTLGLLIVN